MSYKSNSNQTESNSSAQSRKTFTVLNRQHTVQGMSAAYPPRLAIADILRPVVQNPVLGSASYLRYSSTPTRRLKLQSYTRTERHAT
jgi:hypothetical protein